MHMAQLLPLPHAAVRAARSATSTPSRKRADTLLDHTMVVWLTELATGPHDMADGLTIVAGGGGGALRPRTLRRASRRTGRARVRPTAARAATMSARARATCSSPRCKRWACPTTRSGMTQRHRARRLDDRHDRANADAVTPLGMSARRVHRRTGSALGRPSESPSCLRKALGASAVAASVSSRVRRPGREHGAHADRDEVMARARDGHVEQVSRLVEKRQRCALRSPRC